MRDYQKGGGGPYIYFLQVAITYSTHFIELDTLMTAQTDTTRHTSNPHMCTRFTNVLGYYMK